MMVDAVRFEGDPVGALFPSTMVTRTGSSKKEPKSPFSADRSTSPCRLRRSPLTSMNPASPVAPPVAARTDPLCTSVNPRVDRLPSMIERTRISPPLLWSPTPDAVVIDWPPRMVKSVEFRRMFPASLPPPPFTETVPACIRVPLELTILMRPSASVMSLSARRPGFIPRVVEITSLIIPGASKTVPPSPTSVPRAKCTRSRPSRFSVACSPEARTTWPDRATMVPSLKTAGPESTA